MPFTLRALLFTFLERVKKFYSRALRRHSGACVLEYCLYTAVLRSSFLVLRQL